MGATHLGAPQGVFVPAHASVAPMVNDLAVSLLRSHVEDISSASMALARRLRPTYQRVPDESLLASVRGTLLGVASFIENGDDAPIIRLVEGFIAARRESGFDVHDFAVMSHCYLPPVRQVFVTRAATPVEGLAAYDVVESVSLPLIERLLQTAVASTEGGQFLVPVYIRDVLVRLNS